MRVIMVGLVEIIVTILAVAVLGNTVCNGNSFRLAVL